MNSPTPSGNHEFNPNFAIIIGINKYIYQTELKAAVNDAKRLAVFLGNEKRKEQPGGNEWYQVLLLTDEDATHEKLTEVFKNLEENKIYFPGQTIKYKDKTIEVPKKEPATLGKKNRLLIYFAGHGCLSEGKTKDEIQALKLVFQDDKKSSGFLASKLQNTLKKLKCEHKLMILDCCYSGAARESSQKQQPLYRVPVVGNKTYNEDFIWLHRPTFTVITSGGYTPVPDGGELKPEHSPFSDVLLEAFENGVCLGKEVDSNNDNILTVEEIYNYIVGDNRVKQKQHPEIIHITSRETISGQYFFLLPDFNPNDLVSIGNVEKPYKGLFAYEEEDKSIFCGRDELVNQLLERVHVNNVNQKLTIVTGASGSGKSSLVKAGLIPLLKNSNTSRTASEPSTESNQPKQWTILAAMRPGEFPLTALAKTILPIYHKDLLDQINTEINKLPSFIKKQKSRNSTLNDKINNKIKNISSLINDFDKLKEECGDNEQKKEQIEKLNEETNRELNELAIRFNQNSQQETNRLIELIKDWSKKVNLTNAHVLLFIDQFEELITLAKAQEKEIFLNLLVQLVKESKNLHIVLTVRSDFEIYFRGSAKTNDSSNSISQYWNAGTRLVVEEMNSDQLRKAIMIPARRFIDKKKRLLGFESEELVSKIIDDVRGMPGGLALLSFTLDKLYETVSSRDDVHKVIIKEEDYNNLNGVSGGLTKRATEVYEKLGKEWLTKRNSETSNLPINYEEYTQNKDERNPENNVTDFYFTKQYEQKCVDLRKPIPVEDESAGEVRQAMMKQLILRMVATQGGNLAKRPVPLSELQYPNWRCRYKDATYRMCQVIDLLIKERLIVSYSQEYKKGDNEGHENYVEPAHDALILYWDKLHKKDDAIQEEQSQNQEEEQGWLEEYKGNLDLRDRLINDVQKWQELKPEESEESDNKERKPKFSVKLKNYKKIGNFIDNFIELEMRFKLLKKLKSLFVKVIIFFLRLSLLLLGLFMIFVGIFLIISVLAYLVEEFWFLSNGYFSLFITIFFGLFGVLIGLFIALFGLLLISRNLAFRALKFLVIYIFWNSVVRCYRLLRKASNIISW